MTSMIEKAARRHWPEIFASARKHIAERIAASHEPYHPILNPQDTSGSK